MLVAVIAIVEEESNATVKRMRRRNR